MIQRAYSKSDFPRPNFDTATYRTGATVFNYQQGGNVDPSDPQMQKHNAALPHRIPWTYLRDRTINLLNGDEDHDDFVRWTDCILNAANDKWMALGGALKSAVPSDQGKIANIMDTLAGQTQVLTALRDQVARDMRVDGAVEEDLAEDFLKKINSFAANVYGWGPHRGVNTRVQDRFHSNVVGGSATPMTRSAWEMTPEHGRTDIAMTPDGTHIVGVYGNAIDPSSLTPRSSSLFAQHEHVRTNADTNTKWG